MATSSTNTSTLPPVRRVVTGHTTDGKATIVEDSAIPSRDLGKSLFSDLFWSDDFPARNDGDFKDVVKDHTADLVSENGSVFRAVDIPPGGGSPFHRTVTIDYGIVHAGEITCILDEGKRVTLKAGDVFVQRGTIHGWYNETNKWTRMYFVMLPATKITMGDKELETEFRELSTA